MPKRNVPKIVANARGRRAFAADLFQLNFCAHVAAAKRTRACGTARRARWIRAGNKLHHLYYLPNFQIRKDSRKGNVGKVVRQFPLRFGPTERADVCGEDDNFPVSSGGLGFGAQGRSRGDPGVGHTTTPGEVNPTFRFRAARYERFDFPRLKRLNLGQSLLSPRFD